MDSSRIPPILHPLLQDFTGRLEQEAPGLVGTLYLVGSIALDSFNPQWSDIDFIAVLNRHTTDEDFAALAHIHHTPAVAVGKWQLEGAYLLPGDLGREADGEVDPFPAHHDGKLVWSRHAEINPVTWWILKKYGIPLLGPDPHNLPFTPDPDALISWMQGNLNTYWASWTTHPRRMAVLLSDYGIQWAVLGVLRQFYTFREQEIVSKTQAGYYALQYLPDRWRPLIREAIAIREGSPRFSRVALNPLRAVQAVLFLKDTIRLCNEFLADPN